MSECDDVDLQKQAQEILPRLFLGPLPITESESELSRLGINRILSILGFDQDKELDKTVVRHIERHWICVEDRVGAEEQMNMALPKAVDMLHQWLTLESQTVYVHCQSGISRSATVVIAYIMRERNVTLLEAYDIVFQVRPHCP